MMTYWGSGGIVPGILNLGIRWKWALNFTLRSLYPRYPLGGSQSRSL